MARIASAHSELGFASEGISDISKMLKEKPPFRIVVRTNVATFERTLFTEQDNTSRDNVQTRARSVIHSIRVAIDQSFFYVVSRHVSRSMQSKIQFPIHKTRIGFEESQTKEMATKAGQAFTDTIASLRPYRDCGGNEMLCLIHDLDRVGKHRFPAPIGDDTHLTTDIIQRQIGHDPRFPIRGNATIINCTFQWTSDPKTLRNVDVGNILIPTTHIFDKKLQFPLEVAIEVGDFKSRKPLVPFLDTALDVGRCVVAEIEKFA